MFYNYDLFIVSCKYVHLCGKIFKRRYIGKKKKQLPLLEQVTITGVAAEGKAIAKVNDKVVFVPYVAPGDIVDMQLTRKKQLCRRQSCPLSCLFPGSYDTLL